MIQTLAIKNFTAFAKADLSFAKGVNVIIGSNGTGKSHLLKLAYSCARWSQEMAGRGHGDQARPDKATLQKELAGKLVRVFRAESVGRLSRRAQGLRRTEVEVNFYERPKSTIGLSFSTKNTVDLNLDKVPSQFFSEESVFLPTKEMLSMFPGFASLYRDRELAIDETYYDLCLALDRPLLKGRRYDAINSLLRPVEAVLDGSIRVEGGRFYLVQEGAGKFEIPLVAEGFRKLGAVAYLLANGTLAQQSLLFWDEPETNLNPKYMKDVANLLVDIAGHGTQVFIATHSLFMMRELSMLLQDSKVDKRFFALAKQDGAVRVSEGDSAEAVEPIEALDAEMDQSERYLAATK